MRTEARTDPEALHDLRSAARRLRSLFARFGPCPRSLH
ncbi:CHAD domain-containing protein [Pseudomonas corrugata]|nr:CHAD domain-containing protein [Pseudomonas corrugata]